MPADIAIHEDKPPEGPRRREKLPADRRRSGRIVAPVTPAELRRFQSAAQRAELTLSEWVRQACKERIVRDLSVPRYSEEVK